MGAGLSTHFESWFRSGQGVGCTHAKPLLGALAMSTGVEVGGQGILRSLDIVQYLASKEPIK